MTSISDQVRLALAKCEYPGVEIAKAAGIHPVNLSQFKAGRRELPLKNLEALAAFLGYDIRIVRSKKS